MTYEEPPRWLPPTAELQPPPEPPPPPKPREVPLWAPFLALLVAFFVISMFVVALAGIVAATDPKLDLKDDMPIGVLFGGLVVQYAAFTTAALVTVKLSLGRVQRSYFGLVPVAN